MAPDFTEQMCCIFGFCWIELNLWSIIEREPHEVWKPKLLHIPCKGNWFYHPFKTSSCVSNPQKHHETKGCLGAEVCKARYCMFEARVYYVPLSSLSTSSKGKESQWTWPSRVQSPRVPLVQVQHWSIGVCQEQWVLCVEIWVKSSVIGMRKYGKIMGKQD